MEEQKKWTERRSVASEKWSADDVARYLLQRTLNEMEEIRSSKAPLNSTLPKPLSSRKLFSNQITKPSLHGMNESSTSSIWKDLERHFVSDIVLSAKYLLQFVEEVVNNPTNRMEMMIDRKKNGDHILDFADSEDGMQGIPLMVRDLLSSWIDQKVRTDANSKGLMGTISGITDTVGRFFAM